MSAFPNIESEHYGCLSGMDIFGVLWDQPLPD